MTITQIASMNPIARAASIYSLPAEIFRSRLGSFYDKPGARTIPIEPMREGHSPRCRFGEEGVFKQNRGRKAPQKQRSPQPSQYPARSAHYVRSRPGALARSARRCVVRFAGAVVRIRCGPEESSWTFSHSLFLLLMGNEWASGRVP